MIPPELAEKMDLDIFDPEQAAHEKKMGMDRAADSRKRELSMASAIALQIAQESPTRTVSIDLVQDRLITLGIDLGNAAGSLFKGGQWECVGFQKSSRVSNHA